jgi:pimeloyl-ACP methyl ester carboxylesterase
MNRNLAVLFLAIVTALPVACGSSGNTQPRATSTPRPLPTPVVIRQEPQGVTLKDPTFTALPGAKADFGHLGGTVYRIEVPDNWNGRLLLYMHGFQSLAPEAEVEEPSIRSYLIRNGWAWGASSYSSTSLIPGRAADETAALWDYFVQHYGQPVRTYVTGHSMGGAATNISAERYGDRYDGALQLCGFAGQPAITSVVGDFLYAGAYVAGVTQAELNAALGLAQTPAVGEVPPESALTDNSLTALVDTKIKPALKDPGRHAEFQNIMLDLTGGPRAFDREGFALEESSNWQRAGILVSFSLAHNDGKQYQLGPLSKTSSADFNAGVVRNSQNTDQAFVNSYLEGNDITGELQMPTLTMQTTGDWQVPIDEQGILRRKVEGAGKGGLLVQRAVQDARHCGFTNGEWEKGLEDLVAWVEHGKKPKGEDLLVDDLTKAGKFTLAPRFGSSEADKVKGADERITITGAVTVDGQPLDGGTAFPVVRTGDLDQPSCDFSDAPVSNGRYELTVAGKGELAGCGAPGAEVYLEVYVPSLGKYLVSQQSVPWPASGKQLSFDATFASAAVSPLDRPGSTFAGELLDSSGKPLGPGTVVEAYVGNTLCGVSGLGPVVMAANGPTSYFLWVVGPAACAKAATLSFKINGKPAAQTAVNDQSAFHTMDLTLP